MQLGRLISAFKRRKRTDPIFGNLLFMGDRLAYWEGKAHFVPEGNDIEVFVDGGETDDFVLQHALYKQICTVWKNLRSKADLLLETELSKFGSDTQPSSFRVSAMTIPKSSFENAEWTLMLCAKESNLTPSISFAADIPKSITIDT
jgi:hypothetical protein